MKTNYFLPRTAALILVFILNVILTRAQPVNGWEKSPSKPFDIYYTFPDRTYLPEYKQVLNAGCDSVQAFFNQPFKQRFDVFIYADRHALDSAWEIDWKTPGFKSECWMVASGVAKKIDILSPVVWDRQSCEHSYRDKTATSQLITHELIHVFHGQFNASPDFSDTENIDWFVEGLATYASGQLTRIRLNEIKEAIEGGKIPPGLDQFWTGNLRYGLSGSVVAFIDHRYGKATLKKLLAFNKKSEILSALNASESALMNGWKEWIRSM